MQRDDEVQTDRVNRRVFRCGEICFPVFSPLLSPMLSLCGKHKPNAIVLSRLRYKPLRKMAERLPLLRRRTVALLDCVAVLIPCEQ